jgi:hypothetical protein
VSELDPRLVAHRPALVYDSQEAFGAASAAMITDFPGNVLRDGGGAVIARAGERLSLALLSSYPAAPGDRLDERPDPVAAARWFAGREAYGPRVYGRVARDSGRTWLQYWIWGYYNPKNLLGIGSHEGDWELVQVGLGGDGRPASVTCSQHASGEARAWEKVERLGTHPVIYVAPFSHANYFEPGAHPYVVGIDNPDGALDPVVAPVEAFGPWVRWPGRWGNSTGALGGRLGGRSPASPAHQGIRWTAPATYHRLAQASSPVRALSRVLGVGSAVTQPRLGALAAARADGAVEVGWTAGRGPLRGATHLHVTVHDADGGLLGSSVERIRGRAGTLRVPAPATAQTVRVSAYNALRQRSDPLQVLVGEDPHRA